MSPLRSLPGGVALLAAAAAAAPAQAASYRLPASGPWHLESVLTDAIGGSMVVAGDRKRVTSLALTPGSARTAACGTSVRLRGRPSIRRLGDDRRPAVGRVAPASPVIDPAVVSVTVKGRRRSGRLLILFDRSGRRAPTAELRAGGCVLRFVLAR